MGSPILSSICTSLDRASITNTNSLGTLIVRMANDLSLAPRFSAVMRVLKAKETV